MIFFHKGSSRIKKKAMDRPSHSDLVRVWKRLHISLLLDAESQGFSKNGPVFHGVGRILAQFL